jgi:hypothetical protein
MRFSHKLGAAVWLVLGTFIFDQVAAAHLTYPAARDFGTFTSELREFTISGQTTKSFGWADGTDADFGRQDDQRYLQFTLAIAQRITISIRADDPLTMLPAFSIYSGLGHAATSVANPDYDGATVTQDYLTTLGTPQPREGAFDALHTWKIGNDSDPQSGYVASLVTLTYMDNAADGTPANYGSAAGVNGDGSTDGIITAAFSLPAGSYTLVVGGADYASTDVTNRAFTAIITNVPEPSGASLAASGIILLAFLRHRSHPKSRRISHCASTFFYAIAIHSRPGSPYIQCSPRCPC